MDIQSWRKADSTTKSTIPTGWNMVIQTISDHTHFTSYDNLLRRATSEPPRTCKHTSEKGRMNRYQSLAEKDKDDYNLTKWYK